MVWVILIFVVLVIGDIVTKNDKRKKQNKKPANLDTAKANLQYLSAKNAIRKTEGGEVKDNGRDENNDIDVPDGLTNQERNDDYKLKQSPTISDLSFSGSKDSDYEVLEELKKFLNKDDERNSNPLVQALQGRGISSILHFTRVDNLESIARLGICSVSTMRERRVRYLHNDDMRLDGRLNGISLSITHPNSLMFYKYRMASFSKWAILELAPAVIIDHDCRFCFTNAASSQIRALSDEELTGILAFERMFDGAVKANCPTDVQAEVLCLADIPTSYIKTVYVENSWYQRQIEKLNLPFPVQVKKSLFGKRSH